VDFLLSSRSILSGTRKRPDETPARDTGSLEISNGSQLGLSRICFDLKLLVSPQYAQFPRRSEPFGHAELEPAATAILRDLHSDIGQRVRPAMVCELVGANNLGGAFFDRSRRLGFDGDVHLYQAGTELLR